LQAVLAGVLACLLGVLTWQVAARGPFTVADIPVHEWVLRHGPDQSSPLWVPLSDLGDGRVAAPVLAAVAAATWWRRRALRPVVLAAAGLIGFIVVLEAMKEVIGRAAPGSGGDAVFADGTAFPSGHTSAATVMWGLVVWLAVAAARRVPASPRVSRYSCLVAGAAAGLAAGAAMVRMDYHWVSDVAAGWLLGLITLLSVLAAAESSRGGAQPSGRPVRRNGRRPGRDAFMPEPPGRGGPARYGSGPR
jgi:undecaprenyl-diphosphatase